VGTIGIARNPAKNWETPMLRVEVVRVLSGMSQLDPTTIALIGS